MAPLPLDALYALLVSTRTKRDCVLPPISAQDIRSTYEDHTAFIMINGKKLQYSVKEALREVQQSLKTQRPLGAAFSLSPALPLLDELGFLFDKHANDVIAIMNMLRKFPEIVSTEGILAALPEHWPRKLGMLLADSKEALRFLYAMKFEIIADSSYVIQGLATRIRLCPDKHFEQCIELAHTLVKNDGNLASLMAGSLMHFLNSAEERLLDEKVVARMMYILATADMGHELAARFIRSGHNAKLVKWAMRLGLKRFEDALYADAIKRFHDERWTTSVLAEITEHYDAEQCVLSAARHFVSFDELAARLISKSMQKATFSRKPELARLIFLKLHLVNFAVDLSDYLLALDSTECISQLHRLINASLHPRLFWIDKLLNEQVSSELFPLSPFEFSCPRWWYEQRWRSLIGIDDHVQILDAFEQICSLHASRRPAELFLCQGPIRIDFETRMPVYGLLLATSKDADVSTWSVSFQTRFIYEFGLANFMLIHPRKQLPFNWSELHKLNDPLISAMDPAHEASLPMLIDEALADEDCERRLHFGFALKHRFPLLLPADFPTTSDQKAKRMRKDHKQISEAVQDLLEAEKMNRRLDGLMEEVLIACTAPTTAPWTITTLLSGKCSSLYRRSPKWKAFFHKLVLLLKPPLEGTVHVDPFFKRLLHDTIKASLTDKLAML